MPKLSEESLEKRFNCQQCGSSFRTRQGLSGHIQWKHAAHQQPLSMTNLGSIINKAKYLESIGKRAGLSPSRIKAQASIVARWAKVIAACDVQNIKPNDHDYKNYLIASLTRMYENEELRAQLINDFKNLLEEHG